jgi:hypothetical protein
MLKAATSKDTHILKMIDVHFDYSDCSLSFPFISHLYQPVVVNTDGRIRVSPILIGKTVKFSAGLSTVEAHK